MANPLDILFRVKGDSSGAVRALDETGAAAQRAETKVSKLSAAVGTVTTALAGVGIAKGVIDEIQGLIDSVDRVLGNKAGFPGIQGVTSGEDVAARIRSDPWTLGQLTPTPKNLGTAWRRVFDRSANERENIRALASGSAQDRAALAAAVPSLGGDLGRYATEQLARQAQSEAWLKGSSTTVINNYPTGTNPRTVDQNMSRYTRVNGQPRR